MACLCHEYLVEFPYSPRYAIYLVDLGIAPDGQSMPLGFDIFFPLHEGLSRIDLLDQPEPGFPWPWMLGRKTFLAPSAQEPRQQREHVRFKQTEPSQEGRPSPERTNRRRSRSGRNPERQPSFTSVPVAASPAPSLDSRPSSATTNPAVIYSGGRGRSGSDRYNHDRQSESRRARYTARHVEQSSPPEAIRAPAPSAPDIRLHYGPPPSPRRSADSASSSSTNPRHVISRGSVREQSRQIEPPKPSGSYSCSMQSYATDPYHPLGDPVSRRSNTELEQDSHSSRDSFHTASPHHPLPLTLAYRQPVIQNRWFTDNSHDGRFAAQDTWGHQAHAGNGSAEPAGRHDSHEESMPPSHLPPPFTTPDVVRREESVPPQAVMVNLSPLEGVVNVPSNFAW